MLTRGGSLCKSSGADAARDIILVLAKYFGIGFRVEFVRVSLDGEIGFVTFNEDRRIKWDGFRSGDVGRKIVREGVDIVDKRFNSSHALFRSVRLVFFDIV